MNIIGNYDRYSNGITIKRIQSQEPDDSVEGTTEPMLVAIDRRVEDYQTLAAGVRPGAKVVILDDNSDGIEQITRALSDYPVKSLQIVCHGSSGVLYLGKTTLSSQNIHLYSRLLQEWGVDDILLYACNVAADTSSNFLHQLQQLTGANIAASQYRVGNAAKGGSWHLETQIGKVASETAFLPEVLREYSGVFALNFTPAKGSTFGIDKLASEFVLGDFNKDGRIDKVRTEGLTDPKDFSSKTQIWMELGKKNGKFGSPKKLLEFDGFPGDIDMGNLDGDGNLDLAVVTNVFNSNTSTNESQVLMLLGNGKGNFSLDSRVNVGENTGSIGLKDADKNGLDDLLAFASGSGSQTSVVSLLLGNSKGQFKPGPKVGLENVNAVAAGDVNKDGKADLAVATGTFSNPKVNVLLGDGKGKFKTDGTLDIAEISSVTNLALVDVSNNQNLDLLVINDLGSFSFRTLKQLGVSFGDGKGKFASPDTIVELGFSDNFTAGYLNNDKNLDLAVSKNSYDSYTFTPETSVLLGNADGKLSPGRNLNLENPLVLATGDFNGDKKLDIAAITSSSDLFGLYSIEVLKGNGKGKFTPFKNSTIELDTFPNQLIVGDFDGDKKLDLATWGDTTVSAFLGNGKGQFKPAKNSPFELDELPSSVALGDFNKDKNLDLAITNFSSSSSTDVMLNLNQGNLTSSKSYTLKRKETNVTLTGKKAINGIGNNSDNNISGNNRKNRLTGKGGSDTLLGNGGNDTLIGDAGSDILDGGKGNDLLNGGAGVDTLTGGGGKDRFEFGSKEPFNAEELGADIIADFNRRQDKIILKKATFTELADVKVLAEFKTVNSQFDAETSDAFIAYDKTTGNLFYNQNGSAAGFGSGGLFATLEDTPGLNAKSFTIAN